MTQPSPMAVHGHRLLGMSHDWSSLDPLCIIPARGGSKRIRGKNIRELDGLPILSRTIELARSSHVFQEIVVSTDNEEIAKCAEAAGAVVPFERCQSLSDDKTGLLDVVTDTISRLSLHLYPAKKICCLLPSAVLLERADIVGSYTAICTGSSDAFLVAGAQYDHPIERALIVGSDGFLNSREATSLTKRTQDCAEFWHDAGQFYWATVATWLAKTNILQHSRLYPIPSYRAVDLDTEDDWHLLEALYFHRKIRNDSGSKESKPRETGHETIANR